MVTCINLLWFSENMFFELYSLSDIACILHSTPMLNFSAV